MQVKNKIEQSVSLSALLREVEVAHVENDDVDDLSVSRQSVVDAAVHYKFARYKFGKALHTYRAAIPYAGWMIAAQVIAKSIGVNERTVRNVLADYERALPLAPAVIVAMEDAGLDPGAKKNANVVSILRNTEVSNPVEAVAAAVVQAASPKASYIVPRTIQPTPDERAIYKVRLAIRSALSNVPPNRKLEMLKTALAEELYALLGPDTPSFDLTITPCKPTLDLMGLKRMNATVIETEGVA